MNLHRGSFTSPLIQREIYEKLGLIHPYYFERKRGHNCFQFKPRYKCASRPDPVDVPVSFWTKGDGGVNPEETDCMKSKKLSSKLITIVVQDPVLPLGNFSMLTFSFNDLPLTRSSFFLLCRSVHRQPPYYTTIVWRDSTPSCSANVPVCKGHKNRSCEPDLVKWGLYEKLTEWQHKASHYKRKGWRYKHNAVTWYASLEFRSSSSSVCRTYRVSPVVIGLNYLLFKRNQFTWVTCNSADDPFPCIFKPTCLTEPDVQESFHLRQLKTVSDIGNIIRELDKSSLAQLQRKRPWPLLFSVRNYFYTVYSEGPYSTSRYNTVGLTERTGENNSCHSQSPKYYGSLDSRQ